MDGGRLARACISITSVFTDVTLFYNLSVSASWYQVRSIYYYYYFPTYDFILYIFLYSKILFFEVGNAA